MHTEDSGFRDCGGQATVSAIDLGNNESDSPGLAEAGRTIARWAPWTAAQDQKLKQLYEEGYSTSQIAAFFPDKSRNAIIGRIHRAAGQLGLVLRGAGRIPEKAIRSPRRPTTRTPEKPKRFIPPIAETKMRCAAIEPLHLTLLELESNHCRYPYGDGPFTFCGHTKFQKSYCAAHFYLSIGPGTPGEQAAHKIPRSVNLGAG